jgi:hypothetical protein
MNTPHNLVKITRPLLKNKPYLSIGLNAQGNRNALSKELIEDLHFAIS